MILQRACQGARGGTTWHDDPHPRWDWRQLPVRAQCRSKCLPFAKGKLSRIQHRLGLWYVLQLMVYARPMTMLNACRLFSHSCRFGCVGVCECVRWAHKSCGMLTRTSVGRYSQCPRVSLADNARHGSLQRAALVQSLHLHSRPDNWRVAWRTHCLC